MEAKIDQVPAKRVWREGPGAIFDNPVERINLLMHFGHPLAHFWYPVCSNWFPFASLLVSGSMFFHAFSKTWPPPAD